MQGCRNAYVARLGAMRTGAQFILSVHSSVSWEGLANING